MKFLDDPPRFLFFTGKGGVGKTSVACATSIELVGRGLRVLLVSTDPASNIGQVFGRSVGNTVTPIDEIPGLFVLEIDPEQAADAYRERIIAPVRGLLPDSELASIAEGLSGSCTTEVASFDEFTNLLTDDGLLEQYDHIVFDTAPTGHTIRLLQLPGSWTEFLDAGKGDPSCLGPLSGLEKHKTVYAEAVAALADPARTRLVLVARARCLLWGKSTVRSSNCNKSAFRVASSSSTGYCPPSQALSRLRRRCALGSPRRWRPCRARLRGFLAMSSS
nr:TRC40/GET3/ArsA family transport-energizing ATPase [Cryobacterium sp. MLB-32]